MTWPEAFAAASAFLAVAAIVWAVAWTAKDD